jgi:hypothetical protein
MIPLTLFARFFFPLQIRRNEKQNENKIKAPKIAGLFEIINY